MSARGLGELLLVLRRVAQIEFAANSDTFRGPLNSALVSHIAVDVHLNIVRTQELQRYSYMPPADGRRAFPQPRFWAPKPPDLSERPLSSEGPDIARRRGLYGLGGTRRLTLLMSRPLLLREGRWPVEHLNHPPPRVGVGIPVRQPQSPGTHE